MSFEVNYEEDLVPRIRDLIDGYSKDSILKEYLQNADDSGATELVVTFDKRIHASLIDTQYEVAKETSLILYNNANFKDRDFDAIRKISAQGKIEDAGSTGRFGQGFSSSFSISDHPSFVSSGKAYWFDVLKRAVAKGKDRSIQGWILEDDKNEISQWLKTFEINEDLPGTTFRLPLRNEKTANQSPISHEVFKYKDFLSWCDEWKGNTSGLLFLRHIQKLVLQEIDENGKKVVHLEIFTNNSEEIHGYNNKIEDEFSYAPLKTCKDWKNCYRTLPLFSYKHSFTIRFFDRSNNTFQDYEEIWAVVNGLFRGEEDSLIDQAMKVLNISPNPRKVLPWAGVAISLDQKGYVQKNKKSNYHTFLALPITSKQPVHIHGWFDLNPKRTEITHEGAGEDKNILIEWNRLLFKEGVGIAWAYLIDFIKKECDPQKYYSIWPKNNDDVFDRYMLEGFYKKISELECFKTKHKEKICWLTPKDDVYFFRSNSNKTILEAFENHFSIISPRPTQNIIDGLNSIGGDLKEITPGFIRQYLANQSAKLELPIPLEEMPIAMLSKMEWLLLIFIFCAEDEEEDKDYTHLEDLPLELTLDNNVNRIADNRLIDSNPNLNIFNNDKSLFLHPEIVNIVGNASRLPSSWLLPSLKSYLTILLESFDNYEIKDRSWLKCLVNVITKSDEHEVSEAINELNELRIVYQHDGSFAHLKSDINSPLLVTKEEISNIGYLAQTGLQLVHPEYIDIYRPLLKWSEYSLLRDLNPKSLIQHLVGLPEDAHVFFQDKDTREFLTDLLAQNISWVEELSEQERARLNNMPFIATESGNIYAKSEGKNLYLPAGFEPPKHIENLRGVYEIICVFDDKQHAMYRKLGFDEQNPINYLEQIIIPFIENQPLVDDVRKISEWLANSWDGLTKNIAEDKIETLISTLSASAIVIDSDSLLNTASNYYHPDFFSKFPSSLRNEKYLPLKFEDDTTQENWLEFLTKLGASRSFISEHIVTTIQAISDNRSEDQAIELVNYISHHFEWFEKMKFQDRSIFETLSDLAWIPAEKPGNGLLIPDDEYQKLRKPSELILKNDYMIAGGSHYRLSFKVNLGKKDENGEFSEKDIAERLGLLVKLPNASIFHSFRRLRGRNYQKYDEKIALKFTKEFYKYLGRSQISAEDIPKDIKGESVFIKGHWLSSSKVFQTSIRLSGIFSWDKLIENDGKESSLAKGLIKLGVLERPNNEYLIDFLCAIPQNQELTKQQFNDAKAILTQLLINLDELSIDEIPLLSRSHKLILSDSIYIGDLPAFEKSKHRNEKLEFCHVLCERRLAAHFKVVSLADAITPELDTESSKDSDEYSDNSWDKYVRSDPFKSAVLRLIYHEGKIGEEEIEQESLNQVLPLQVRLMESLVVRYSIDDTWVYDDFNTPTYHDTEKSILYLRNEHDDEDMCDSIAKFISNRSGLGLDSFSLLARIIRHDFRTFEDIHNLLDRKNIKSLPEKVVLDEADFLYSNGNVENVSGGDLDTSSSDNLDDERDSSSDSHSSILNGLKSDSNSSSGKKGEAQSGGDIPPPIRPKGPDSSNMQTPASRHDDNIRNNSNPIPGKNGTKSTIRNGGEKSNGGNTDKSDSIGDKKIISSNDRKPIYVGREKARDPDQQKEEKESATEIGNKGESYVLENSTNYLLTNLNKFEKTTANNMGFDILETDPDGETMRYIEVKTLTGQWGEGGVSLTPPQLKFAQANDNWWLFVVENIHTPNTIVHTFENPVQQANRFTFDHSWKQLADTPKVNQSVVPKEGDKYLVLGESYCVTSVQNMGKLYKVRLKEVQTGKEISKKFDPSWGRL